MVTHLLRCPACATAAAWPAAASIPLACQCWALDAPADRLRGAGAGASKEVVEVALFLLAEWCWLFVFYLGRAARQSPGGP